MKHVTTPTGATAGLPTASIETTAVGATRLPTASTARVCLAQVGVGVKEKAGAVVVELHVSKELEEREGPK